MKILREYSPVFVLLNILAFFASNNFAATAGNGPEIFIAECGACHLLDSQEESLSGSQVSIAPSLSGIVGKAVASTAGFNYSSALTDAAKNSVVWNQQLLTDFVQDPKQTMPGTSMGYPGLTDSDQLNSLVQWLMTNPAQETLNTRIKIAGGNENHSEVARILDLKGDKEYGEYLASECLTCHTAQASSSAVPRIHQLPAEYFIKTLLEYKNGKRDNAVMKLMAGSLGDEEIAALAKYFSE